MICTAVASDPVFTVRTYEDTAPPYGRGLVRNFGPREPRNRTSESHRPAQSQIMAQLRSFRMSKSDLQVGRSTTASATQSRPT